MPRAQSQGSSRPISVLPSSPRISSLGANKAQCDRSVPCHACIIRGLEAECTYLTTAEDRAHISQAEIIERLRREVAELRGQLSQGPRPPSSRPRYAHTYNSGSSGRGPGVAAGYSSASASASASGGGSADGGSWPGSSPSSTTTMTNSVTVTSPDSTGSENGAQLQAYPVPGFGAQGGEMDVATVGEAGLGSCESDCEPCAWIGANRF
jgi:hypothetical protein